MIYLLVTIAALNLLGLVGVYRSLGALHKYVAASNQCLALELDLIRGQIDAHAETDRKAHRHACEYIGGALIEDEIFPKLGIPKNPPTPLMIQMQKRAICSDEGLREHFKLSPETAKKILTDLDAEGVPPLPWEKNEASNATPE